MVLTRLEDVRALAGRLRAAGTFAFDMEFQRERTYWPRLQLLQLGTPDEAVAVDPLALDDLSDIWELIADPTLTKIVHAGRQDAEIYFNATGGAPRNLYDTQVAAALVGLGEQVGYAALVQKLVGVRLEKHERITDWGQRPLRDAQVEYALNDVRYLHSMKELLDEKLASGDRSAWLREELSFYENPATFSVDRDTIYMKVSGWRTLNRRGLGLLRELARWREDTAAVRDLPRQRVVPDDVLVEIASRKPTSVQELKPLRRLHPRELERSGEELIESVRRGIAIPDGELPRLPKGKREDPDDALVADLISVLLRKRAKENAIAVSYVGTQKDVGKLVDWLSGGRAGDPPALAQGWRARMIGDELGRLYDGRLALRVVSQKVVTED